MKQNSKLVLDNDHFLFLTVANNNLLPFFYNYVQMDIVHLYLYVVSAATKLSFTDDKGIISYRVLGAIHAFSFDHYISLMATV